MQTQNPTSSKKETHNSAVRQSLSALTLENIMPPPPSNNFLNTASFASNNIFNGMGTCSVSAPPSSTLIGDYIGVESCLDLKKNDDIFSLSSSPKKEEANNIYQGCSQRRFKRDRRWEKKEFPPPITLLARTENLPSHMPWVLRRYYTTDGRLILREEKVRHHEYFRAHRSNGRLTLHLVPLDDQVLAPPFADDHGRLDHPAGNENDLDDQCCCSEKEEEEEEEEEDVLNQEHEQEKEEHDQSTVEGSSSDIVDCNIGIAEEDFVCEDQRVPSIETAGNGGGVGGNGSGSKCLNYISVRTGSTCIFGVPVPATRPVHS